MTTEAPVKIVGSRTPPQPYTSLCTGISGTKEGIFSVYFQNKLSNITVSRVFPEMNHPLRAC
jgi:hypothetical protein